MQGKPTFAREGHHTGGNSSSVGEGIQGSVMSWKQVLIQHTIFNSGRTDVDKSSNQIQRIIHYRCSFREDTCIKLNGITPKLDTTLDSTHKTVHSQLYYTKVWAYWEPKNLTNHTPHPKNSSLMHLSH
jgi:hypothetical protein